MAGTVAAGAAAADAAPVRLRLLGGFSLVVDGEERGPALPARAASLLAFLVLRAGSAQPRQRIAQLLWPESSDGQARTNLRNVLHHLRRSAPELTGLLEVGSSTLRWVGGPRCHVDLTGFLTASDEAARAPAGSPTERDALRTAVRRYEGDLLADHPDEWLAEERAHLRERHLSALRRLITLLATTDTETGNAATTEAVGYGRELVRRDPLNEEHHRLLIAAHRAVGDRAGAVRAYHDCVTVLRQELGISPSAATRDAYTRLIAEPTDRAVPVDTSRAAPFVGRGPELTELIRRWHDAASGSPGLVLVTGEPGVGKTRLVEELAARCAREGALVVPARCYAGEGELGYSAVIDWLRSPELAAAVRRVAPSDRRHLARLLPELAPSSAEISLVRRGEMDRLLLFDAIVRMLTGGGRPVLLTLDDAHWCDGPSLHLVHYLIRSATGRRMLVVATARREEIDDHHPLATTVQQLLVLDRAAELDLRRLSVAETGALARSLGPIALDEPALHQLHAQTEGNPLFVVEAIRAGWDGAGDIGLTPKLQSVIAGRLRRLSPEARELVEVAAVIGRTFTADLLGRAAGRDELAVVRGLDELWRRGVVESHGIDGYDFSHGRIRDVAYDSMTPVVRQRWHTVVAQTLATSPGMDVEATSGQIAAHFDRAGRVAEAIDWYEKATAQAIRRSAHNEAYGLLRRAMVLARRLPEAVGASVELRLLAMAPPALGGVDGYSSDRLAGYERRARALASRLGAEVPAPLLRSSVMGSLCRDEFGQAAEGADRLLAVAQNSGDRGLAVEGSYLQGIVAFWSGDLGTAADRFREVIDGVDEQGRAAHLVRFGQDPQVVCLSRLANTLYFLGDTTAARSTVDDALALAERVGDQYTRDVAHIFAALLAADLDDATLLARAVEVFRDGRDRSGPALFKSGALLGYADVQQGRAAAGIQRIEESIRRCGPRNPAPGFVPTLHRLLVGAYHLAGDAAGGLAAADRALALGGTRLWEPEIRRLRRHFAKLAGGPATPGKRSTNAAATRLRA